MINEESKSKYAMAISIINEEQEKIIGANISRLILQQIDGLKVQGTNVSITGDDPKSVLKELVNQYASLFGKASINISKEAIKKVNPSFAANELPDNLK